ncbi:hypothetical protein CLOP_g13818 [Closterium sp. NIES-67]|nr:hypothetical protein CLOP_g13818 [Closterium sp. NIES-67]
MKSSAAILFLGLVLAALCCAVQAHDDDDRGGRYGGGRGGRYRWPAVVASGEASLKACPRVWGVRGSAAIKNYQFQNGSLSLTYQLLLVGTSSAPTSQSIVTGDPCDTLVTPTTVQDLPGTWVASYVRWSTGYRLYGSVDGTALMTALQSSSGYRRRSKPRMYIVFRGNGTIAGRLQLW